MIYDLGHSPKKCQSITEFQNHRTTRIMDPLSIALGGFSICQIASKIIQFGIAYGQAVSSVPEEVQLLVSEITLLSGVFTALCSSLQSGRQASTIAGGLIGTLEECNGKLEELYAFLVKQQDSSGSRLRKLGRALKWPLKEQDTRDWIARMERYKNTFSLAMQRENNIALKQAIEEVRVMRLAHESERIAKQQEQMSKTFRSVIAWLSPANPRENHLAARELQQRGTGLWFLTSKAFELWKTERNPVMWLHGSAGTGKSILSSIILDHLLEEEQKMGNKCPTRTIYFYCDYRDVQKQTPAGIYGSLLAQIVETYSPDHMPPDLQDVFMKSNMSPPLEGFLKEYLLNSASKVAFGRTRVVIDGLDECEPAARTKILQTMMEFNRLAGISLLITSRDEVDIKSELAEVPKLRIDASVNSQDITSFVMDECERNNKLRRKLKGATKQEVIAAISSQADGMFRWAKCQLDQIAGLRNDKAIKKALTSLPSGLNETYERIVGGISDDDKDLALRILRWLTCSLRPLSVSELVEGIAIELGDTELDPETFLNDPEDVIEICGSLVQLDINADTVTLGHFSVKEFFVARELKTGPYSDYFIDTQESNIQLAKLCLTYLCLDLFRDGPCSEKEELARRCDTWALYKYASKYWGPHAQGHTDADDMSFLSIVERFFLDEDMEGNFDAWMEAYEALRFYSDNRITEGINAYLSQDQRREKKPLVYACALGLYSVTKYFLSKGVGDVRAQNTSEKTAATGYGNALSAACTAGSLEVARLIVDAGADVNAMAGQHWLALNVAVKVCTERNGPPDFRLVEFLIEHGADVNRVTPDGNWPLKFAADTPITSIEGVRLCLEAGADQSMRSSIELTPFESAGVACQSKIFELLRQHGGGQYMQEGFDCSGSLRARTAAYELFYAVASNFHESAKNTLQKDGEILFKEPGARNILLGVSCIAARMGYYKFLEPMMAYADNSFGALPECIKLAAVRGHPKTLGVLLDVYKPSPEDKMLRDLMVLAAGRDNFEVVNELIKRGVPAQSTDQHGWTVDLVTRLTSLNKPMDLTLFADTRLGIEPLVKKPSGWKLRPIREHMGCVRSSVVFEGSSAYLPPDEPWCIVRFNHPVPPQAPYFYFETIIEEMDPQDTEDVGLDVSSACTDYNKNSRAVCYSANGTIAAKKNRSKHTWPTFGKGSVVGCAVDLINHIAFFTCDGKVLDATVTGVKGMVCCQFRMNPGVRIRSNFGERPFLCDAVYIETRLAADVTEEDGRVCKFSDRGNKKNGLGLFCGDGSWERFVG
ncbi:hypothetical protein BZA05DRAFT_380346 [Tricharina praecox]|uniref:uncharacterized protein n=1 Tax=Tricharina praecox TaxID=43433 RepID=UPI00221ED1FB|nr:uncharacterized protein BZA05DRAFT_380346 [Tricharina praecox]KAI5841635.1 hypothetical protein BZA05DRAFT_380346 [Tricharina praecox]